MLVSLGSLQVFSLLSQICRSVQGALQGLLGTQCLTRPAFRQNLFSMFNCAQSLFVPQLSSVSIWHLLVLSQNCSSLHSFLVVLANSPYFVGFLCATAAAVRLEAGQEEAASQVFVPPLSSCLHTDFPFTPMQSKLEEQGTGQSSKDQNTKICPPGLSWQFFFVLKTVPLMHQHPLQSHSQFSPLTFFSPFTLQSRK